VIPDIVNEALLVCCCGAEWCSDSLLDVAGSRAWAKTRKLGRLINKVEDAKNGWGFAVVDEYASIKGGGRGGAAQGEGGCLISTAFLVTHGQHQDKSLQHSFDSDTA
jgi:hypothetical protein